MNFSMENVEEFDNLTQIYTITLGEVFVNGSLNETNSLCDKWDNTKYVLHQAANFCCFAAFLTPHKFEFSVLLMRSVLSVGFFMLTLWAGVNICSPDIFAWNLTLLLTNFGYTMYMVYNILPPRIDPELMDLYQKIFTGLKVNKQNFKELVRNGQILSLEPEEHYAMEGITPSDERLSILLSGKMKATCEDVLLHFILPNEFIDSPEWEACPMDSDQLFQVSLIAVETCRYVSWPRQVLQQVLHNNQFLDVVLYNLIGKDITHKLYSLNEFSRPDPEGEWWRIPRSLSVDAVHTGTKGHVRSLLWRAQDRRASSAPSDSLGSSPARTSAHYSDPGPFPSRPSPAIRKAEHWSSPASTPGGGSQSAIETSV